MAKQKVTTTRKRSQGQRLLRLLRLLEQDALTSAQLAARLAPELACTQQEIQRDIRLLRAEGWRVSETEKRPKRYFLTPDTVSPDTMPRTQPVRAVVTHALLRMLHHHAPTPSRIYHQAATELAAQLPERLRQLSQLDAPSGDTPRILEILATAWCRGEAVTFSYLKPHDLVPKSSTGDIAFMEINRTNLDWYVFIRRRDDETVKTFHLSRFLDVVRHEDTPSPPIPFDIRDELDGAWGIIGGKERCDITLRFLPDAVPFVKGRRWPGQLRAEMDGEHLRLTVRAPLNHQHLPVEVLAWIRGWGPRVEVLSPQWVRERWLAETRELLARYDRDSG